MIKIPKSPKYNKGDALAQQAIEAGWLGKLFGSNPKTFAGVIGIVVVITIAIAIIVLKTPVGDMVALFTLLGAIVGYLFSDKRNGA